MGELALPTFQTCGIVTLPVLPEGGFVRFALSPTLLPEGPLLRWGAYGTTPNSVGNRHDHPRGVLSGCFGEDTPRPYAPQSGGLEELREEDAPPLRSWSPLLLALDSRSSAVDRAAAVGPLRCARTQPLLPSATIRPLVVRAFGSGAGSGDPLCGFTHPGLQRTGPVIPLGIGPSKRKNKRAAQHPFR